jgi:hypothetical protein
MSLRSCLSSRADAWRGHGRVASETSATIQRTCTLCRKKIEKKRKKEEKTP